MELSNIHKSRENKIINLKNPYPASIVIHILLILFLSVLPLLPFLGGVFYYIYLFILKDFFNLPYGEGERDPTRVSRGRSRGGGRRMGEGGGKTLK